jgi:hypothetical protein
MIEKVENNNKIFAIIIRSNYKSEGIEFFTPNNFSQQLGYMNRPKGYEIEPHFHKIVNRTVKYTNEVLYVKSGKVKIDFYDEKQFFFSSKVLNEGDVILLVQGGHGFEMIEDSEMIEVKQGPYINDEDKVRFEKKY